MTLVALMAVMLVGELGDWKVEKLVGQMVDYWGYLKVVKTDVC